MNYQNGHGSKSVGGLVPERWLDCPRKSQSLIAEKFLAFKTPLCSAFDDEVPVGNRFTPSMLFESTKLYKMRIGLWIDLTYTNRFYTRDEIEHGYLEGEVKYVKLQCRGHGETPTKDQTRVFVELCHTFIRQKPLEIIGVHCTHGFNRTGFLIISYMVEKLDWSVEAAIEEFARARPPGIYKEDYIKELYSRYDDVEYAIPPPTRPSWCKEYDHDDDEEEYTSGQKRRNNFGGGTSKRSKMDKIPTFMEGVSGVTPVLDKNIVDEVISTAQNYCNWDGKGFPGSQPVSMDLSNINLLRKMPYQVSWKADGTRYMMLILCEGRIYFLDRDDSVFQVSGLKFAHRKNLNSHLTRTLLDGEMVIDKHENKNIPRYLVYDIIRVNDIDVSQFSFYPQRLNCIEADVIRPRYLAVMQGKINKNIEPFSVRLKQFFSIEKAESLLSEKFSKQLTHKPDGLIFQPSLDPYEPGQCKNVLKWKPATLNSIDFRLRIVKEDRVGMLEKNICELLVGNDKISFATMKYSPKLKEYNNKIIECKFENNGWVFMRERTDKSYPNSYKTALAIVESIKHPVTQECLLNLIEHNRYKNDKELMPPPRPNFHRR